MASDGLMARTRAFALRVVRLAGALPRTVAGGIIARQIVRCGTSVGANYRSARRARSKAEFVSRLGIVEEEADESIYWMELLVDGKIVPESRLKPLMDEARAILAMTVASINTARGRRRVRGGAG